MASLFGRDGEGRDYESLTVVQDRPSGLRAIIAVHSTWLGPAFGGIRRVAYESDDAALSDALALAHAMSQKCALAGLPAGGAKTVIVDHPALDRAAAYTALGVAIERLGGRYVAGPDLGSGDAELARVRAETQHVNPVQNDAGAATASGVLAGLRAALRHRAIEPADATCVVEGLGAVGGAVAAGLRSWGATVVGIDPDLEAAASAGAGGVRIVPSLAAVGPMDVFCPCAVGGTLTAARARTLGATVVCGSANNQLARPAVAQMLHDRGITWVPDIVVSAGAVIEGVLSVRAPSPDLRARVAQAIAAIEDRTLGILRAAAAAGEPPLREAQRLASAALHP